MDRETELARLANAEKAVTDGERHIQLQEQRVAELDRDHDTKRALATLATFRQMQAEHVAHRDLILKMLQQDAAAKPERLTPIFRPGHYSEMEEPTLRTLGRPMDHRESRLEALRAHIRHQIDLIAHLICEEERSLESVQLHNHVIEELAAEECDLNDGKFSSAVAPPSSSARAGDGSEANKLSILSA
jgi:hypothetical protein